MTGLLEDMAHRPAAWLAEPGADSSVTLSSRVRLARNVSGLKYPSSADPETLRKVINYFKSSRERSTTLSKGSFFSSSEINDLDRDFLVERHLISPTFLDGNPNRALLIGPQERVSIMINEEDHVRVQALVAGLDVHTAYKLASEYDDEICKLIDIDYDPDFGFLTTCPTNVGTGMRASVLIHLPGLVLTREIDSVISRLSKLGLVVRGFYGEGSDVLGNLLQVSNQTTLGVSETEILSNIDTTTKQIIEEENIARLRLIEEASNQIEDKVWRAFGILSHARTLSSDEVMNLLSAVRLGISLGRLTEITFSQVNEILLLSQPAHLQKYYGEEMDPDRRDFIRAEMVRAKMKGNMGKENISAPPKK
ncbi:MAG: protein arginine kinase [candidate division Zixibacteria bacterium]|nr:protein arginine kinase [candidate division Zixibacteria bacterium]